MRKLCGKTALITGGSSGIGLATAKAFVREGVRVAIGGHNQEIVDRALTELPANTLGVVARVERLAEIDSMMNQVRDEFGGLDILVLCAEIADTQMAHPTLRLKLRKAHKAAIRLLIQSPRRRALAALAEF